MTQAAHEKNKLDPLHLTFTSFLVRKGIDLWSYTRPYFLLLYKGFKLKKKNKEKNKPPKKRRKLDTEENSKKAELYNEKPKTNSFFDWLPPEILMFTLSFVSISDLCQIAKTCKAFNHYSR